MLEKLDVKNFRRSRKFGIAWGYCDGCSGEDRPTVPEYTGTWNGVKRWLAKDRAYQAALNGGVYIHRVYFYNGYPISFEHTVNLDTQAQFGPDAEIYVKK